MRKDETPTPSPLKPVKPGTAPQTCSCKGTHLHKIVVINHKKVHLCNNCGGYLYTEGVDEPIPKSELPKSIRRLNKNG